MLKVSVRTGLLQSRISPLRHQRSECFVEMIGECASGMSDSGLPLSGEQSQDGVVEHGKYLGGMAHAHLSMIFSQRGIASILEAIFHAPMPSGQVQYACGMSHLGGQTGDPVAKLCCGHSQGIGPLAFQFADLSQFWPGAVLSSHAAHGDAPLFQASVSFPRCERCGNRWAALRCQRACAGAGRALHYPLAIPPGCP